MSERLRHAGRHPGFCVIRFDLAGFDHFSQVRDCGGGGSHYAARVKRIDQFTEQFPELLIFLLELPVGFLKFFNFLLHSLRFIERILAAGGIRRRISRVQNGDAAA